MSTVTLFVLVLVILLVVGVVPAWPHSRGWGYGPAGLVITVLVVVLLLALLGVV